jgi:hypothetical protein
MRPSKLVHALYVNVCFTHTHTHTSRGIHYTMYNIMREIQREKKVTKKVIS